MNKCQKCGADCDLAHRFCPKCGTQLYVTLDQPGATPESFVPLLNSLYNLLAIGKGESAHPERTKYIPELSDLVMIRRSRIEHQTMRRNFLSLIIKDIDVDAALMDFYKLSLSNALAGYAYRSVEEMIYRTRSERLSVSEKNSLISSMSEGCGDDLRESGYKDLRADDVVDRRLLFCLALRWNNRHLNHLLAEEPVQREWWATLVSQNFRLSENCAECVFRAMGVLKDGKGLSDRDKESARDNAEEDLIHGYIVRFAESLDTI
jgi:hypothetical protein